MKKRELPGALLSILFHRVAEYLLSTTVWLIDQSASTLVYGQLLPYPAYKPRTEWCMN
jgi:hypothetical protein